MNNIKTILIPTQINIDSYEDNCDYKGYVHILIPINQSLRTIFSRLLTTASYKLDIKGFTYNKFPFEISDDMYISTLKALQ